MDAYFFLSLFMRSRTSRPLAIESLESRIVSDNAMSQELNSFSQLPADVRTLVVEAIQMTTSESSWKTPSATEATTFTLPSSAQHLNLRGTDGMVRGVRATVSPANSAVTVTAHLFRGNDEIATVALPTNGQLAYETDNGITDVVFRPNARTTLSVTNIETSTLSHMPDASSDPLAQFSSRSYALAAAPSVPLPSNLAAAVKNLKLQSSPNGNGDKRFYAERDPNQYTLFRIEYSKGSGNIGWVGTIMKTGVDYMNRETVTTSGFPEGYMQRIDANTVVIAPGAPRLISFGTWMSGATGRLTMKEGITLESVLPPAVMSASTVDSWMLRMDPQFQEEGIFPGATEIRESSSPVFSSPGHQANVWYNVKNDALGGGSIGFDIYAGWYTGEPTRGTLQKRFDTTMTGGQTIKLSANVTAPSRPADATSDRPIISIVTRFQNGTTEVGNRLGKEAQSRDTRIVKQEADGKLSISFESTAYTAQEQARIRELTDRALREMLDTKNARLSLIRDVLGEEHIVALIANIAQKTAQRTTGLTTAEIDAALASIATEEQANLQANVDESTLQLVAYSAVRSVPWEGQLSPRAIDVGEQGFHNEGDPIRVLLREHERGQTTFSVDEPMFLNVSVPNIPAVARLTLRRSTGEVLHQSPWRNGGVYDGSALSMSCRIDQGDYILEVERGESPPEIDLGFPGIDSGYVPFALTIAIDHPTSNIIRGVISKEGSAEVMPIRMTRFVQDGNGRMEKDLSKIPSINTEVPTWIVVHGMNSKDGMFSEHVTAIQEVAKSLQRNGNQILIVDWEKAAKDTLVPLGQDAPWTEKVGKWIGQQLMQLGFDAENINGAGHSHGTYVLHAMGKEIMSSTGGNQMNALVALDPAGNFNLISGFDHRQINFSSVSKRSVAFESSFMADSNMLAGTADLSVHISSPETSRVSTEHQLGMTTFAEIMRNDRNNTTGFADHFSYAGIMALSAENQSQIDQDAIGGIFEYELTVGATLKNENTPDWYWQGLPYELRFWDNDGNEHVVLPYLHA